MSPALAASGQHRPLRVLLGIALAAALLLAALVPAARAATGPRPLSPTQGKIIASGAFLTFRVRDTSAAARTHHVWLTIANRRRTKHGVLQTSAKDKPGDFARMRRRKHGIYTYTPPHYNYPGWYLVTPHVYYWQAYHIDCGTVASTCDIAGGIRHFRVK
ncbi:MAG: periplasmic protein TonB [Solirubrobacteraceae bacterium]|jgi:hypothetical protein|nr:periplasmic protein TonB [Solirubrobacteraceae bacterium]